MMATQRVSVRRTGKGAARVTNIELFFDLVYVFAVTQISDLLLHHLTAGGALQAAIVLLMVWQVWVYTTWSTNYLDPAQPSVRVMLLALMLGSLVLAAEIPRAFEDRGLTVAIAYAAMQLGRAAFEIYSLRGDKLQWTYRRVIVWSAVSGTVFVVGGCVHGHAREILWIIAIAWDLIGSATGFRVPGMGHSSTADWTISGGHFAERCQAFVLIALGESIVVIGATLSGFPHPNGHEIVAFGASFLGAAGLWWIYFDRSAEDSARAIETSQDPGKLARNAFHWVHPLIIAGIIVTAAADERIMDHPTARGHLDVAWLALGGTALYLGGHALFKYVVFGRVSWSRIVGVVVLLALVPLGAHVSALTIGCCGLAVIVLVVLADRLGTPPPT